MKYIRRLVSWPLRAIAGLPGRCTCTLCGKRLIRFLPYVSSGLWPFRVPALMQALDLIGSDVAHFSCPHCLCHDRERHVLMYLQASGMLGALASSRILHMAPEPHLAARIKEQQPVSYVRGDLYPTAPDIERIDLLATPFSNESFDLVIANHVLEHVDDDLKALHEIARILAPGGYAVLQTPYAAGLETTWSDPRVKARESRLQAFGQEDHVRLYGADIFERFASAGLSDRSQNHVDVLSTHDASYFGINPREPFFLFQKLAVSDDVLGKLS